MKKPAKPPRKRKSRPHYPDITVRLIGRDGNAFAILGSVGRAMREAGVSKKDIDQFYGQATAGSYEQLLATCCAWVTVQ